MMSKTLFILILSLFCFCRCEPECSADPCKDLWTAKACNKVKHCISEDWSKRKPTGNTDNVCDICLRMVKEARDTLESNETRQELLQVFEGSCKLLMLKPAVELCDNLVDGFVPELVDILSSQMDPETVCSVAKLCNNDLFRKALKNSKECVHCKAFAEEASKEMNSMSTEDFKNKIFNLCRDAGSFSDSCFLFALDHSSLLYNTSKLLLEKKPCQVASLCPSDPTDSTSVTLRKKPCSLCLNVVKSFRKQLLNVKSKKEFDENIFNMCTKLGYSQSQCSKLSNSNLYEKVKASEDLPRLLCHISFCRENSNVASAIQPLLPTNSDSFSSSKDLDVLSIVEHLEMFFPVEQEEIKESATIAYGDPVENPIFFARGSFGTQFDDCETCKNLLNAVAKSNGTKKSLKANLNEVCGDGENSVMCKIFVENFSSILSKAFVEGFPTTEVCEDLMPSCQKRQVQSVQESDGNTCKFCMNVAKIFKEGDSNVLAQTLEEKCSLLPEDSQNKCILAVSNVLSFLKNSSENETCSALKLCGESRVKVFDYAFDVAEIDPKSFCDECVSSLEQLQDFIKRNNSDLVIKIVLNSLCAVLPHVDYEICHKLLISVGFEELKHLILNMNPKNFCSSLHLCGKQESSTSSTEVVSYEKAEKVPCKFCLMAMKMLMDQLENDKTEEAIRNALDGLCKYFPEETRDTCKNLINEYAEEIIDMIVADFNATEICVYLKICLPKRLLQISKESESPVFDVHTNEIKDSSENLEDLSFIFHRERTETHLLGNPQEENFLKFRKVVQECAMCEALVGVISSHKKMIDKNYDFPAHANMICYIVPSDKKKLCKTMVVSYGPSIVNLLNREVDPNKVCVEVDLCDSKLQAKVDQPVSVVEEEEENLPKGDNDCLRGPVFWCANAENAEKCGTFLHCQETVWKTWDNPPKRPIKI